MFENHRKRLIQHCERSELSLQFEWPKVHKKCQNSQFGEFLKTEGCGQTVLPDKSFSIGKNCWKMPKFKNPIKTF